MEGYNPPYKGKVQYNHQFYVLDLLLHAILLSSSSDSLLYRKIKVGGVDLLEIT